MIPRDDTLALFDREARLDECYSIVHDQEDAHSLLEFLVWHDESVIFL
jgi:hypothetical protein